MTTDTQPKATCAHCGDELPESRKGTMSVVNPHTGFRGTFCDKVACRAMGWVVAQHDGKGN